MISFKRRFLEGIQKSFQSEPALHHRTLMTSNICGVLVDNRHTNQRTNHSLKQYDTCIQRLALQELRRDLLGGTHVTSNDICRPLWYRRILRLFDQDYVKLDDSKPRTERMGCRLLTHKIRNPFTGRLVHNKTLGYIFVSAQLPAVMPVTHWCI